ncbi:2-amino-4-hydroxy-6-hydroxymethyldihydropteridine diphosphokinase [Helicobacter sp. 12S02634-8]|uniref:2-amino-4-hydroxy-6- hydroxymethyldihydropteridine diphosphokinase n=1 Tax=Helicobacter sp. 12S02634-8 TaxID=1476199 RepID=UPI000BA71EC7|nr:2-amino-4-hydroxy-6-hydroxymethyldihydropteridine diphosphokinase [Helicobacter sp. 12S02634-8]PAF47121.1 2-amino-4-hydroxy-6-hydroxymethyldihydropteridine diphosphokinase [Helicobacter sp. 12S02634-8]
MRALYFSYFFPYQRSIDSKLPYTITLGIGGNVGDCKRCFMHLWRWFMRNKNFSILSTSPIYQNPPFGYKNQNDFYNATITLATRLGVCEIFGLVFYLERRFGRPKKRAFKNAPRKLDLDIIFFNDLILKRPYLKIPHSKWHQRESVLVPLFLEYLTQKRWK